MVQEVDELSGVTDAYERLEKYYVAEGKIDPGIFAEVTDEMEKFEGSEDDVSQMEMAQEELQVNGSDAESSASARGRMFQVVTDAVRTFVTKQNMRMAAKRAGEEIYSKVGESYIKHMKESLSSEERPASQQATQYDDPKHVQGGSNGGAMIKNVYKNCKKS